MRTLSLIAALAATLGGPALAEPLTHWGDSGDWEILIDAETGNGCLAQRQQEDGVVVQVGSVPNKNGGFFAAMHADWTDIEEGVENTLKFDFGDAKFKGDGMGVIRSGLPGGYAFFDNPNFVQEFGKRNSVKVWGEKERVVEISLAGTKKAIDAVLACQKEQPESGS